MKKIFKIVIFLFFLVLAIFSCAKGIIKQYVVNTVRKSYFYEEQSATIGEILNTITKNGKWSYTTDDGIMVVHFEGNRNDDTYLQGILSYRPRHSSQPLLPQQPLHPSPCAGCNR